MIFCSSSPPRFCRLLAFSIVVSFLRRWFSPVGFFPWSDPILCLTAWWRCGCRRIGGLGVWFSGLFPFLGSGSMLNGEGSVLALLMFLLPWLSQSGLRPLAVLCALVCLVVGASVHRQFLRLWWLLMVGVVVGRVWAVGRRFLMIMVLAGAVGCYLRWLRGVGDGAGGCCGGCVLDQDLGCPSTRPVVSVEGVYWSTWADCLSGNGHEVYVESCDTDIYFPPKLLSCRKMSNVWSVPYDAFDQTIYLKLKWPQRVCGKCEAEGMFS
ncbi:hypothetical protein RHMOL_Rhmol03G0228300 [Rhododendron molle]|uniref:Uncharacterized protein n=1 Tax=Rhododendron molle TaxID=49168 RepID=A0ACC0PHU7_RHOML|nr:hypothetical protein RHMOL_Rhmol03G0228300 [Rhododendron molle]